MHEDFLNQVHMGWCTAFQHSDPAKLITAKFKNLRKVLKQWKRSLSNLKANISNVKLMLQFLNFWRNAGIFLSLNGISELYLRISWFFC
jgi:hypothetical protein